MRILLIACLLLCGGCGTRPSPKEPFLAERFTHPPEIWIDGDRAFCRLRERTDWPVRTGSVWTESYLDEARVYAGVNISHRGIADARWPLHLPGADAEKLHRMRFFWRDPDGTLHSMAVHHAGR